MAEKGRHYKKARYGIILGSIGLVLGVLAIIAPGRDDTEGGSWSGALGIPMWGLGVLLLVIGGFNLFLGLRQHRLEKRKAPQ